MRSTNSPGQDLMRLSAWLVVSLGMLWSSSVLFLRQDSADCGRSGVAQAAPPTPGTVILLPDNQLSNFLKISGRGIAPVLAGDGTRQGVSLVIEPEKSDWSKYSVLACDIENKSGRAQGLSVEIEAQAKKTIFTASIAPYTRAVWKVPIFHLRYAGASHWPSQPGITMSCDGDRLDTCHVRQVKLMLAPPADVRFNSKKGSPLAVHSLSLREVVAGEGWIDEFGQNGNLDWPGKIHNLAELKNADENEQKELSSRKGMINRDLYQGFSRGPTLKATGFFRLDKVDGRWWLVAPNGHLFYSTGLDCAGCGASALLNEVSRSAYSSLPSGTAKSGGNKATVDFHTVNLMRKWGEERFKQAGKKRTLARCLSWGFTCLGNWSDKDLQKAHAIPYTSTGPSTWELKIPYLDGDIPDVYHPRFEEEACRVAAKLAKTKNDPWLIGYFLDNELPWWSIPYDVLALDPDQPAKVAWLARLKAKYKTICALNRAWATRVPDFNALRWTGEHANAVARKDMNELMSDFAGRFYSVWYRAIKKGDPNHLVLGSRMPYLIDPVVLACARHTDVLSFNHYQLELGKEFDRFYKLTGKPFLIGEYAFDSLDAGLLTAYVPVQNQKERGVGYTYYTEQAASKPYFVGSHYFQYLDEPITGRDDGETSFNGFVAVTDVPYKPLVEAARQTNARIYEIHAGNRLPSFKKPQQ